MADDQLAAALAAIREDYAHAGVAMGSQEARCRVLDRRFPQLLGAVDAVLALHQRGPVAILGHLCRRHEAHRYFSITSAEAADVAACTACTATTSNICTGCGPGVSLDSCPARAAITRALAGADAGD